jgi:hypothetical protein
VFTGELLPRFTDALYLFLRVTPIATFGKSEGDEIIEPLVDYCLLKFVY